MLLTDFDYVLPEYLIAQVPIKKRDESRLLIIDKDTSEIEHKKFKDIINYLNKGDTLVLNDTKVLPARLIGEKESTKAHIELLLLKNMDNDLWECLAKPVKRLKKGTIIQFGNILTAYVEEIKNDGLIIVDFKYDGIFLEILDKLGTMPLPPYIHKQLTDQNRYQTIYAKNIGSSAAPTAGLHFTKNLLKRISDKGINIVYITLHVGLGTFRPVMVERIEEHEMHSEYYMVSKKTVDILNETRKKKGKVVAVGTTCVRTLECIYHHDQYNEMSGWTNLFITPGYKYKGVDELITNFHLPKSTLLMLVSAFAGTELIRKVYAEAIRQEYRFFSFGDAMMVKTHDARKS